MNKKFSENLKKIRKEHNLSQEQLAEELGVSRQAISKWESGQAYPEMDKIIFLCDKFDLNIDDLLHRDIKEVKGEEETKNSINKYIEEFFKAITDTVNLFFQMKFGSKLKLLFEEGFIALVLFIISSIISSILAKIIYNSPLRFLSTRAYSWTTGFLGAIYSLVAIVISVIIMARIFKSRYLDYYEKSMEEKNDEKELSTEKVDKKEERISLKEPNKIVIRDPENSNNSFFKGLFKLFLICIKFCVLWIEFFLCLGLLFVATGFVLSFMVSKTGLFFVGLLLGAISLGIMDVVIIVLLFNFIFDRKSNKKVMIWSFVSSIIVLGVSCGLLFIGSLDFNIVPDTENYIVKEVELDMNEKTFINHDNLEYIIEERDNIRVEYQLQNNRKAYFHTNPDGSIYTYGFCDNQFKEMKIIIESLNKKEILDRSDRVKSIKVYASSSNIEKMKNNYKNYYDREKQYDEHIEELENEINEKEESIRELQNKIYELEETNETLKGQIEE